MTDPSGAFIDYPALKDVARGDMLAFEGHWRRVKSVEFVKYDPASNYGYTRVALEGVEYYEWPTSPLPRIAAPLLDALRNPAHPYR